MSYVLDALRRADAERSHGLASPLTPPASSGLPADSKRRSVLRRRAPWLLAAGLGVLALWLALWLPMRWTGPDATAQKPSAAPGETNDQAPARGLAEKSAARPLAPPAADSTALPVAPAPAVLAPARTQQPQSDRSREAMAGTESETETNEPAQPLLRPEPSAAAAFPAPRPRVSPSVPGTIDEETADVAGVDAPAAEQPRPVVPQAAAQAARTLQPRAPLVRPAPAQATGGLAALPGRPDTRVSGVTYSGNPEHRMLIVNGQVVHEGGEVSPGHVVEAIGQRSAVINHQGTRYNINY